MDEPTPASRRRSIWWWPSVLWAAASLAMVCYALSEMRIDPAIDSDAGARNLRSLWPFWIAAGSSWTALSAMLLLLLRRGEARGAGRAIGAGLLILAIAGGARTWVVLFHAPALSDDIWRYIFDGRNLANGVNPYLVRPIDRVDVVTPGLAATDDVFAPPPFIEGPRARWPGEGEIAARVNNPELHTIYLPVSQMIFSYAAAPIERGWVDPKNPMSNALVFRAVFAAVDMIVIILLLFIVHRAGRSAWWAALYAWHPLPLAEFAGSGHQEVVGLALLAVALRFGTTRIVQEWAWSICLALAALIKPVVIPVAAFILRDRWPWWSWFRSASIGFIICLTFLAPFMLTHEGDPLENYLDTAERFTLKWAHFGGVYEPALWAIEAATNDPEDAWERPDEDLWTNLEQEGLARALCGGLLAVVAVLIFWRVRDPWAAARMFLFAAVLLTPAAHPWYLLWAFVIVPMRPSAAVWVASFTLLWGYAAWGYVGGEDEMRWGVAPAVLVAAYAPVYLALLVDGLRKIRTRDTREKGRGET